MPETIDPEDALEEIRRAAFDLRQSDPHEAVRVLRRLLKAAGTAEPLVHGALGEILLEEFDDLDGALHHFRRLIALAPGLPAGHVGLARALVKNGDARGAREAYGKAQEGLAAILAAAKDAPAEERAGLEEAVLTTLELALEDRELEAPGTARSPDRSMLDWAENARIFDSDLDGDDDVDDWARFAGLRATLEVKEGSLETALATIERIAVAAPLPPSLKAQVRSFALEAAGRLGEAAEEAGAALGALEGTFEIEDALRAAALHDEAGTPAKAEAILEALRGRLERERAQLQADDDVVAIDALLAEVQGLLAKRGPTLVTLGAGLGRRPQ